MHVRIAARTAGGPVIGEMIHLPGVTAFVRRTVSVEGGTARLNVGFVFSRRMIALDGWVVSATSRTKEQGGHDQRDMEQFQCVDVRPPAFD